MVGDLFMGLGLTIIGGLWVGNGNGNVNGKIGEHLCVGAEMNCWGGGKGASDRNYQAGEHESEGGEKWSEEHFGGG